MNELTVVFSQAAVTFKELLYQTAFYWYCGLSCLIISFETFFMYPGGRNNLWHKDSDLRMVRA